MKMQGKKASRNQIQKRVSGVQLSMPVTPHYTQNKTLDHCLLHHNLMTSLAPHEKPSHIPPRPPTAPAAPRDVKNRKSPNVPENAPLRPPTAPADRAALHPAPMAASPTIRPTTPLPVTTPLWMWKMVSVPTLLFAVH